MQAAVALAIAQTLNAVLPSQQQQGGCSGHLRCYGALWQGMAGTVAAVRLQPALSPWMPHLRQSSLTPSGDGSHGCCRTERLHLAIASRLRRRRIKPTERSKVALHFSSQDGTFPWCFSQSGRHDRLRSGAFCLHTWHAVCTGLLNILRAKPQTCQWSPSLPAGSLHDAAMHSFGATKDMMLMCVFRHKLTCISL